MKIIVWIGLIFAAIIFLLSMTLLLKDPVIWPDEAIYADIAHNLISQNRMGYDLLGHTTLQLDQHVYWYPPIFLSIVTLWLKVFGESILNQRLFSVLISFCFLVIYYLLIKDCIFTKASGIRKTTANIGLNLSFALVLVDYNFLNAAKISRPEILVLLLGTISLYFFQKDFNNRESHFLNHNLFISGLFSGFAMLTHFMGLLFFCSILSYFLISFKGKVFKEKLFFIFIAGFIIPIIIWLLTVYPYYPLFIEQLETFSETRNNMLPWFIEVFINQSWIQQTIFTGYFIVAISIFLSFKLFKTGQQKILLLVLIFSGIFSLVGKLGWYYIYTIPFIYTLSVFVLIKLQVRNKFSYTWLNRFIKYLISAELAIIFILCIAFQFIQLNSLNAQKYSYDYFSQKLFKIIPRDKTILESSIPDVYFVFRSARPQTKIYQFPSVNITRAEYLNILNDSDYVIYTQNYCDIDICDLLPKYLKDNQSRVIYLKEAGQYAAQVIELTPRNQRIFSK